MHHLRTIFDFSSLSFPAPQAAARGAVSGWLNELGVQQLLEPAKPGDGEPPGLVHAVAAGFLWGRPALLLPLAEDAADAVLRKGGAMSDSCAAA